MASLVTNQCNYQTITYSGLKLIDNVNRIDIIHVDDDPGSDTSPFRNNTTGRHGNVFKNTDITVVLQHLASRPQLKAGSQICYCNNADLLAKSSRKFKLRKQQKNVVKVSNLYTFGEVTAGTDCICIWSQHLQTDTKLHA